MATLRHIVSKNQLRNSKRFVLFLAFLLVLFFGAAIGLRFYVFEPLRMNDSTMFPKFKEKDILWVCKYHECIDKIKSGDYVWAQMRNKESLVRRVLAMPGEKIKFYDNGKVRIKNKSKMLSGEDVFIESRKIRVPQKGDTLYMNKLNDVEQDYAINILVEQGVPFYIKTSLWQGDRELPIDMLGASKLGNRQVSLQEIDLLPWQDRHLLELQVFQREVGNTPIKIKRDFFSKADSAQIEKIVVDDDYYFLISENLKHSPDSRELGYFSKAQLQGRFVDSPNRLLKEGKAYLKKIYGFFKDVIDLSNAN